MKRKARKASGRLTYLAFTIVPVLLYTVFYVYSMVTGIGYSFTNWNGMDPSYDVVGFNNYRILFQNPNFWNSLRVTLSYAALLVVGVILLSTALALALNSIKRFKTFAKSVFFLPAMISAVTVALIFDQLFYRVVPVVGQQLGLSFLSQSPLASGKTALFAVVFVNIWQAVALPTVIFIAALQTVPDELYESAMLDGATVFQRFRTITLPYLLPTVTVNLVLTIKQGFTSFDYAYALTGGGPARATELVGILIYNDAFQNYRFGMANAEAVVLFVIVALFSILQISLTEKRGPNAA